MSHISANGDNSQAVGASHYRAGFLNAFWTHADGEDVVRGARRENILAYNKNVYHYTSLAGFQGIIASSGFWASDNRFMNDAEEMAHGVKCAAQILEHCGKRKSYPEFAAVLDAVRQRLLAPPRRGNLVACFSTARDSLEQWRGYGPSGAVCIGLRAAEAAARPIFFGPDQLPIRALYDPRPKAVLLLSIVRRFEREYARDRDAMAEHWPASHDGEYVDHLTTLLSARITAFKNSYFRNECEIRIVIRYESQNKFEGGLKFRAGPLGIIPYVCTGDRKGLSGRLPISEVIIGPSPHQELLAESVNTFMEHNGYTDYEINLSRVPYRS